MDKWPSFVLPAIVSVSKPAAEECWLQTYSGGIVHPLDPKEDEIRLQDIAAALSKLCRFGGHCAKFYSVAEHCVLMSQIVIPKMKLATLMHDASEAYLVDVPRPLKPWLVGYTEIENRLMAVIAKKFGFDWPLHPGIKEIDTAILTDERAQNMASMNAEPLLWGNTKPALGIALQFWDPDRAQYEFCLAYHTIRHKQGESK